MTGHVHQPDTLMFDRTGRRLLSATLLETTVRLWDVDKGQELRRFEGHGHGVRRAEFSPDGQWAVSGDQKGIIKVWGVNAGDPVDTFRLKNDTPVWAFHGSLLAVPVEERGLGVWNLEKRQWVHDLGDPGQTIEAIEFLDAGKRLISFSHRSLTLWSLDPEAEIISIPAEGFMARNLPRIAASLDRLEGNQ